MLLCMHVECFLMHLCLCLCLCLFDVQSARLTKLFAGFSFVDDNLFTPDTELDQI